MLSRNVALPFSLALLMCVVEGSSTPLSIQGVRRCFKLFLARIGLHHLCMGACHRLLKEGLSSAGKGSPTPRGRPPLDHGTSPPPSRGKLWAGPGLLPMVFCPIWVELVGIFVIPSCKSASESAFQWISACIYVCDLQNMLVPKHVESVS
jgi:hypothetical protein